MPSNILRWLAALTVVVSVPGHSVPLESLHFQAMRESVRMEPMMRPNIPINANERMAMPSVFRAMPEDLERLTAICRDHPNPQLCGTANARLLPEPCNHLPAYRGTDGQLHTYASPGCLLQPAALPGQPPSVRLLELMDGAGRPPYFRPVTRPAADAAAAAPH